MQSLQQELWTNQAPHVATHAGDLAWWLHRAEAKRRLWLDDAERCVAWGWLDAPAQLAYEVSAEHREGDLHREVLAWLETEGTGDTLTTYVLESDRATASLLESLGYQRPDAYKWYAFHLRELDGDVGEPTVPGGFRLRTVASDDDFRERVAIHRAVWAPSRVTEDVYRRVTQAWPYRADLDCVVEAPDGRFAAYVLCWYDDMSGVGLFEPVGTHPDFRRRGLGAAVCRYGLQRLREEGATHVLVLAAEERAVRLYESVGFRRYDRVVEVRKARA